MTNEFNGGAYFPNTITINGITYIKEEELVNSEKAADAHIEKLEKEIEKLKEKLEEADKYVVLQKIRNGEF